MSYTQPFTHATVSPTPSGLPVKSKPAPEMDPNDFLQTLRQFSQDDFRPTFYNPFEIKHRRRTSTAQLKVLEKVLAENPKPNATVRRILAQKLNMTPRGVQIWFQNRRAKAKLQRRKASCSQQQDTTNWGYDHHHCNKKPAKAWTDQEVQVPLPTENATLNTAIVTQHQSSPNPRKPAFASHCLTPTHTTTNESNRSPISNSHVPSAVTMAYANTLATTTATAMTAMSTTAQQPLHPPTIPNNWAIHPLSHPNHPVNSSLVTQCTEIPPVGPCFTEATTMMTQQPVMLAPDTDFSWYTNPILSENKSQSMPAAGFDYGSHMNVLLGWNGVDRSNGNSLCTSPSSSDGANTPSLNRGWSLDTIAWSPLGDQMPVIPMDLYSFQDMQLSHPSMSPQRLAPPLASTGPISITQGSHISVDRHDPPSCYLSDSSCLLTHAFEPSADYPLSSWS